MGKNSLYFGCSVLAGVASLVGAGCNQSAGSGALFPVGSNLSPLSSEQKSDTGDVVKSASRLMDAIHAPGQSSTYDSGDPVQDEMSQQIASSCSFSGNPDPDQSNTSITNNTYTVSGSGCAVTYSEQSQFGTSGQPSTTTMNAQVISPALEAENDVDQVSGTVTWTNTMTTVPGDPTLPQLDSMTLNATGNFHSQKWGSLGMVESMSSSNSPVAGTSDYSNTIEMKLQIQMPGYTAEFREEIYMPNFETTPTNSYFINGVPSTQTEFDNLLGADYDMTSGSSQAQSTPSSQ